MRVNIIDPLRPIVNMHILLTVDYRFVMILGGRICLNINYLL